MQPPVNSGVRADFDVPATMRDGVILRANIFRPDDAGEGRYPVLLMRLPYGKDFPLGSSLIKPVQAARRGYIVAIQDVRGTFTSEGEFDPMRNESVLAQEPRYSSIGVPPCRANPTAARALIHLHAR